MTRGPGRTTHRALAGVLLAVLLAGSGAPAAAAADTAPGGDEALRLSTDGATWATQLPASLFGPDALVVPGSTVERDLWVRNDGPTAARVLVDLADDVDPTAGGAGLGAWLDVRLDGAEPDAATWAGPVLDPGEAARVEVGVAMSADAPSSTRRSVAGVLEAVHLVGVADAVRPPAGQPPTGPGLARTGADAWWLAVAAVLATGTGVLLGRLGRKFSAASEGGPRLRS
ncbi:hypothetical protein JN535_20015 [Cellulosimicrobium cellulans]|uniref:hypothetical protein n=1 Tax=Cellulosimicrobium cellulans TaxID=1710 RepID=UPI00196597AA|nr:hypothetical protein [Cellulosimicrobium cellulans]MBN0042439.1 hypothetical protein [Cellulosimicrobium cellulans]